MTGGPTADGSPAQQFGGDSFDGPPVCFLGEQVFDLGQQPAFEPFGLPRTRPLRGETADVLLIASGASPGVLSGVACLGRDASERDKDLAFEPVLGRPEEALAEGALAESILVRQYADPMDGTPERQRDNGMAGFVIGGGGIGRGDHLFNVPEQGSPTNG